MSQFILKEILNRDSNDSNDPRDLKWKTFGIQGLRNFSETASIS
jgi:hypothetical protein